MLKLVITMEKKGNVGTALILFAASAIMGIIAIVIYQGILVANKVALNSASTLWLVLTYVPTFLALGLLIAAVYVFVKGE